MVDYTKGVVIKTRQASFGEVIKVGIKLEEFKKNPISKTGWIDFEIKKSKFDDGGYYAENDNYEARKNTQATENTNNIQDDELPF